MQDPEAGLNSIFVTQDGSSSIFSDKFGVSYHSKYGAIQESKHVFIQAGLLEKFKQQDHVNILEFGFGSGLNAFLSFLESINQNKVVYFETLDAYPIRKEISDKLNYVEVLGAVQYTDVFKALHELPWSESHQISDRFTFCKRHVRFEEVTVQPIFDVIFYDAFAPTAQPELWDEKVLGNACNALKSGGIFVTYCAKGVVKRTIKSLGFEIEPLKGPPGKREMTRAWKI